MLKKLTCLLLILALFLTACAPAVSNPDGTGQSNSTQESTPDNSSTQESTPESNSTQLDNTITVGGTSNNEQNADNKYPDNAIVFVHGKPSVYLGTADLSECVEGSLYLCKLPWLTVHLICLGPIHIAIDRYDKVFFVKEEEPNKIYSAPLSDITQHTVVYESDSGTIDDIVILVLDFQNEVLQILEDNKRLVLLDLTAGTKEVILEQYYIERAYLDDVVRKGSKTPVADWKEFTRIYFYGKLGEGEPMKQYLYYWETGKIEETYR